MYSIRLDSLYPTFTTFGGVHEALMTSGFGQ